MSAAFAPWANGSAHRHEDGRVTGTFALKEEYSGWTIESIETFGEGQFVSVVFAPPEMEVADD